MIRGPILPDLRPRTQSDILESSGEGVAINFLGNRISYPELRGMVESVSSQLEIGRGDVVILSTQNIPQFVIAEYAVWRKGGIVLPVNPSYTQAELDYLARDSGAKLVIASCESNVPSNLPVIRTNPHTFHKVEGWNIPDCEEELNLKSGRGDRVNYSPRGRGPDVHLGNNGEAQGSSDYALQPLRLLSHLREVVPVHGTGQGPWDRTILPRDWAGLPRDHARDGWVADSSNFQVRSQVST